MKPVVLDNSALLPLFLPDEGNEFSQRVIRDAVGAGVPLLAPTLCLLEFGHGILRAVRRARLTEAEAAQAHRGFARLPIAFREFATTANLLLIHGLAQRRTLSFYDATYLALAIHEGARLASLDDPLRAAAAAEGVEVEQP